MSQTKPGPQQPDSLSDRLAGFANWFNEHVVGSPWTYLTCIALVVIIYSVVPIQGYEKWNISTGLFFNTASSSIELITGVGAVVGVYAVRRSQGKHRDEIRALHADHRSELQALHTKIDRALPAAVSELRRATAALHLAAASTVRKSAEAAPGGEGDRT